MAQKPRVLIISDTPVITSGMGIGHYQLASGLHETGKYTVASFGWFWHSAQQQKLEWKFPWKQFTNSRKERPYGHPDNWPNSSDTDYKNSAIYQVINDLFKPDIVIGMGDYWMLDYVYRMPIRDSFKFIHEIPIDGEPVPKFFIKDLRTADVLVSMSQYGKRVIQDRDKYCNIVVIPRGINVHEFTKINAPKDIIREKYMPAAKGNFVVGVFDRFQDRKQIGRAIEAFAKFISDGKHKDCDLYLHMDLKDPFSTSQNKTLEGEDGLIERYGIKDRIIVNRDVTVEKGVATKDLNAIYNCCDVRLSATQGEGFGLTIWEAMACGLPVIATNYTTPPELLGTNGERGLLANVQAYISGMYNIERALIDTTHAAKLLDKLYRSPSLRREIGENARRYVQKFKWDSIIKQWEQVIDNCVKPTPYRLIDKNNIQSEDTKDINIYGAVRENTGWAITTRGVAQGFKNNGWNVKITEGGGISTDYVVTQNLKNMMEAETSRNLAFINHMPEHTFKIAGECNAKYKILYFPFELDHMTYDIVTNINRIADIYACPSKFVENIAKNSGVLNTAVIPLASDIDTNAEAKDLGTKKSYKFLMLGNLGDKRKNLQRTVKAFIASFTDNDDVCLILKSMPGHKDSDPTEYVATELLGRTNPPEVRIVHCNETNIAQYFAACDCLLMPSLAEGWGHPVFQALKFGMPVIASNYGGYLEFINNGKNIQLVNGGLEKAKKSPLFKAHEAWFVPNFNEFAGAMKKAFALNMRKTGENYVADYTWTKTAKAIEDIYKTKISRQPKTRVYYERMIKNLWNRDNEVGFKGYAPVNYEFVTDPSLADFQILDITRISDKYYLRNDKYVLFFHTFGEWVEEDPTEFYDLFNNAMFVYSHIDLASIYPTINKNKFMRGPWGCQPDLWFKKEHLKNDEYQILCTGEIASTEGIRECIAACDGLGSKLLHIGHNFNYQNNSYVNKSNLSANEMNEAYNKSRWVSALRRIEGFEKPAIEGLLCGARPICFDTPLYRYWYEDLARYVKEGTEQETCQDILKVMQEEYAPITSEEINRAIKKFAWFYVARNFWEKINTIKEGTK